MAQNRRLPAESPRPSDPHRPRELTWPARPPRRYLPAHPRRGRNPPTWSAKRSWTGSRRSLTASRTGFSASTSSDRSESGPPQAQAGPNVNTLTGCPPPITARTACAISTVATRSATTPCGASTAAGVRPQGTGISRWAKRHKVEFCFTPTYSSWANPIEAHFGPLPQFTIANSSHPNHTVQNRALHAYFRWRNANARHRDVLAAERKERAPIRSEAGIRWGGQPLRVAA